MFQAVSLIPLRKPPRFQGTDRTPAHPGAQAAAPDTSHSAGQPHASSPRPSVPWNPCSHHSSLALPPCHCWHRRSAPAWHKAAPGNRGDQDSLVVFYPWQPSGFLWSFLPISNSSEGTGLETQIPRVHPRCCTSKGCLPRDVHKHKAAILMSNQEFKENAQPQHQQNLGQMIWFELLGAEPLSVKLSQ